ncbi:alpha-amylase [Flexibacter flexilis DSM 6793]|uniref:Alpha-amylase n=1 Tax=Flexibacter flexilis DSM 6793 TaxID=927664 RepID=A0A1I1DJ56_9BACT|nr:alpha-amylase domain-containing protein [Flexibacter flexilis]SFB72750.1 alpha-amylase [Flexibacter flexilis DSM 6793]
MKNYTRRISQLFIFSLALWLAATGSAFAQNRQRVILQGFWWNFKNNNYPQGWANYLSELAPRLRAMGINAVWVPVNVKNANPQSVGYVPFDHYDLGDKYQKSNLKTPFGDKDEFLRMVAILHANGIEVIQDVVLNHMNDAGSASGAGGQDPAAVTFYNQVGNLPTDPTSGYKNYRYACYETPATDETAANYLARKGRWPKNWQNFYPTPTDARFTGDDLSGVSFGTDIAYRDDAIGLSSISTYNPAQSSAYMRNGAREWLTWMKKQTGIDGYRLDAVKHFPSAVSEDMMWNMRYNAGFASGADSMFAVGEWVGGKSELDAWADAVQNRAGTFDFAYRGFGSSGLSALVYGMGNYDLSNLPAEQQNNRSRTAPFINNHDTFRPPLQTNGNYPVDGSGNAASWTSGDELARNIDPREPRFAAAYAAMMAIDGTPVVFFEDLFDVGTTGKRYSHLPTSTTDLPVRSDIANIIRCHQKLGFKKASYLVRMQTPDHLIIERSGKAVIGINDSWSSAQTHWIDTQFAPGTQLKDYAGSSTEIRVVQNDKRVNITTPPCDGTALRRGYSIWAPVGIDIDSDFAPEALNTTQEWEMANDLGDKHARSLQQSGALPAGSLAPRTAGKIFVEMNKPVTYNLYPSQTNTPITALITDQCGNAIDSVTGTGNLTKTYLPMESGWLMFRVRNASAANPSQKVWLKASYTAPRVVNTAAAPSFTPAAIDLGADRAICSNSNIINALSGTNYTYQWFDLSGNVLSSSNIIQITAAGTYIATKVNTITGCSARDTIVITEYVQAPTPTITQSHDTLFAPAYPNATYQWLRNNGTISGAMSAYYVPTQSGSYAVRVTNSAGCLGQSPALAVTSVRNSVALAAAIDVFPNPAKGIVSVKAEGYEIAQITVLNVQGQQLETFSVTAAQATLNLQHLPAGVYCLQMVMRDGQTAAKSLIVKP